jgi:DNA helicase II / ATP-dependent DNA helicase PcrA
VVECPPGPLLVVAGAGTGKTRALTYRVSHFVEIGLSPERILLLTFTQRAAREMTHRVVARLGDPGHKVWAGTFHAIGARILRSYATLFGYDPNFSILGPRDAHRVFVDAIQEINVPPHIKLEDVLAVYSLSLNANRDLSDVVQNAPRLTLDDLPWIDHLIDLYISAKMSQHVMDYDDLLTYWYVLLGLDEVKDEIMGRFDAVLVDEYQDVCPLQAHIIDRLVASHKNLTVVGDDCQAIYGFRGADVGAILGFGSRYPDHNLLRLQTNYRSSPQIVAVANRSISNNRDQYLKTLVSARGHGPTATLVDGIDSEQIAQFVAHRILSLKSEGVPLSEQAVLYRTHAQARVVQIELQRQGIPFVLQSGLRVFDRPHVRGLLSICRVASNPWDGHAWADIIQAFDGLGPVAASRISEKLLAEDEPWVALSERDLRSDLPLRFHDAWSQACQHLIAVRAAGEEGPAQMMAAYCERALIHRLQIEFPDDVDDRLADLQSLITAAMGLNTMAEFMDIVLLSDGGGSMGDVQEDAVILSTVHRSKGLEWAAVFVIGLYDGGFPLWSNRDAELRLAEERRLFYVAITRASRWLYLCHPWADRAVGQQQSLSNSRFIDELGPGMLDHWRLDQEHS